MDKRCTWFIHISSHWKRKGRRGWSGNIFDLHQKKSHSKVTRTHHRLDGPKQLLGRLRPQKKESSYILPQYAWCLQEKAILQDYTEPWGRSKAQEQAQTLLSLRIARVLWWDPLTLDIRVFSIRAKWRQSAGLKNKHVWVCEAFWVKWVIPSNPTYGSIMNI